METNTLKFPNVERVLKAYADSAGDTYRSYMQLGGKDASGKLSQSAKADVRIEGTKYQVVMHLEEYWKWVENGRPPYGKVKMRDENGKLREPFTKFPPPNVIRKWIEVKPVIPRPMKNGKLPTINQLAYLIGRKIATVGIVPSPVLELTVDDLNERFMGELKEALAQDLGYMLKASMRSAFE